MVCPASTCKTAGTCDSCGGLHGADAAGRWDAVRRWGSLHDGGDVFGRGVRQRKSRGLPGAGCVSHARSVCAVCGLSGGADQGERDVVPRCFEPLHDGGDVPEWFLHGEHAGDLPDDGVPPAGDVQPGVWLSVDGAAGS